MGEQRKVEHEHLISSLYVLWNGCCELKCLGNLLRVQDCKSYAIFIRSTVTCLFPFRNFLFAYTYWMQENQHVPH